MRASNKIMYLAALLLVCLLATAVQPAAAKRAGAAHPEVDPAQDCASCHQAQYKQWYESRHATGGVLCLVCHGSTSENFARTPVTMRCQGCHAAQVESLPVNASARKATNRCFTCHAPHSLKLKAPVKRPHVSVSLGGGR